MRILQIFFLLNVCGCPQAATLAISDILEIVKLSKDLVTDVVKKFKLLDEDGGLSSKVNGSRILFDEMKVFKNKIDMLSAQIEGGGSQILYAMVDSTNSNYKLKLELREVIKNIDFIELKYKTMGSFIESKAAYEDLTLEEFARSVVSPSNSSSQSLLDRIHVIIAPNENDHYEEDDDDDYDGVPSPSVFKILHDIMSVKGNNMFCNMQTSEQQLLLNMYNTLALTELKGLLMMEFSYMLLKLNNHGTTSGGFSFKETSLFAGNFAKNIEAAQKWYKNRSARTLKLAIGAVRWANYDLWKCDPCIHVKNKTYIEITELLQGYIENKKDLNAWRSCKFMCSDFTITKSYDCWGQQMFCNKNRQCKGTIINCQFIADATVCLADAGTNRRYEYINQKGKVLGRKKDCAHNSASFEGWWRLWTPGCDYCMCFCDEQGVNSDRYFSMRSTESDINHNKVVTGLRFVKKNRIIHLQIQEGKLLPRAKIDVTTVQWKPVEDYRIDDPGVRDGQDYHTLTWVKRGFNLGDLFTVEQELLTGVRFQVIGFSQLDFQIRITPFNFKTGTLMVGKSRWKHEEMKLMYRKKIHLDNRGIPIRSPSRSLPVSDSGGYLQFTHSGLDIDVAQTTVPFIDAQAVASKKPVPLCGAGMRFKGNQKSGGFIYPKIMTYDYSKILHNAYDDTNY